MAEKWLEEYEASEHYKGCYIVRTRCEEYIGVVVKDTTSAQGELVVQMELVIVLQLIKGM